MITIWTITQEANGSSPYHYCTVTIALNGQNLIEQNKYLEHYGQHQIV